MPSAFVTPVTYPLPDWVSEVRPHQVEAVEQIVTQFRQGAQLVILDAPPGCGKTLIAELVRRELATTMLYLCTTHTLQDQFAQDFPYAQDLRGRSNYPTLDYPERFGGGFQSLSAADCDKAEGECSWCSDVLDCPYETAKMRALKAEVALTNTAYFLSEANFVGSFAGSHGLTVVDECDTLQGLLMNTVSVRISPRMQKQLDLRPPKYKTKPESWELWFDYAVDHVRDQLRAMPNSSIDQRRRWLRVKRLHEQMKLVAKQLPEGGWVYDGYTQDAIEFLPVKVDGFGMDKVFTHGKRWLLMSGTVIAPRVEVEGLGYDGEWGEVTLPSPFDPARSPVRVWPVTAMKHAERETAWPEMARGLQAVLDTHDSERILVHTNSYGLTSYLLQHLPTQDRPILSYMAAGERPGAIAEYRASRNGVLLASSLDRGFDGAGDLVPVQVVCKIPFPDLGSKQVHARLYSPGGQTWYSIEALRTLIQMTGRGMRHSEDECVTYILDAAFGKLYRDERRWLPDWWKAQLAWGGPWKPQLERRRTG